MRIIGILLTAALLAAFLTSSVTPVLAVDTREGTKIQTQNKLAFDSARTAVLIMDYQNDIVGMLPEKEQLPLLEKAGTILKEARQAGLRVIYVVVRFREGFPEISPRNKLLPALKNPDVCVKAPPEPRYITGSQLSGRHSSHQTPCGSLQLDRSRNDPTR